MDHTVRKICIARTGTSLYKRLALTLNIMVLRYYILYNCITDCLSVVFFCNI